MWLLPLAQPLAEMSSALRFDQKEGGQWEWTQLLHSPAHTCVPRNIFGDEVLWPPIFYTHLQFTPAEIVLLPVLCVQGHWEGFAGAPASQIQPPETQKHKLRQQTAGELALSSGLVSFWLLKP